jgi:hypothetical protein
VPAAGDDPLRLELHEELWWQWLASVADLEATGSAAAAAATGSGKAEQWVFVAAAEAVAEAAGMLGGKVKPQRHEVKPLSGEGDVPFIGTFLTPSAACAVAPSARGAGGLGAGGRQSTGAALTAAATALPAHLFPLVHVHRPPPHGPVAAATGRRLAAAAVAAALTWSDAVSVVAAAIAAVLAGHSLNARTVAALVECDRRLRVALGADVAEEGHSGEAAPMRVGEGYDALINRATDGLILAAKKTRKHDLDGVRFFLPR